jgi:hypothetical protein
LRNRHGNIMDKDGSNFYHFLLLTTIHDGW